MSNLLAEMKEFKSKNPQHRYCNGYISIGFRGTKSDYDINRDNFSLNGMNDGWFRKIDGLAKGHGLCINNIRVTNRKYHYFNGEPSFICNTVGDFLCYKAIIDYTNNDFDSKDETDLFWIFVHKNFALADVLDYIEENKEGWYP
jgi:hypothetical protein